MCMWALAVVLTARGVTSSDALHDNITQHIILVTSAGTIECGPYPQPSVVDVADVFGDRVAQGYLRIPCVDFDSSGARAVYVADGTDVFRTYPITRTLVGCL
ncbi:MAG: hypothetical protein CHACPFDD_04165 [Phycisphaerae bacterium]|nr:hypothetical protein [Phycisphaerae bacterium]